MIGLLNSADRVLRGQASRPPWALAVFCGLLYGAVMGTFGGVEGDRGLQVVYSAAKVPMLLLATVFLSLPSFFVLNTLFGLRDDFREALRAVVASQAALAIVLVSCAPLTLFWYASSADYQAAILFNALMFGTASIAAQGVLRRSYRRLIARNHRHRVILRGWLLIYAFVGIQLGWTLRPFIGDPARPIRFLRGGELENAYVIVARMFLDVLSR
jgi:hypothetical protein